MKITLKSGASIATIAANLLLGGHAIAAESKATADAKGHCVGANACKGQSACMTAKNSCAGQNSCKGQGFTETTAAECAKIEGAKFEPAEASK